MASTRQPALFNALRNPKGEHCFDTTGDRVQLQGLVQQFSEFGNTRHIDRGAKKEFEYAYTLAKSRINYTL